MTLNAIVRRFLGTVLVLLGLLFPVIHGLANPNKTLVVISSDGGVYREIVRQLESSKVLASGHYDLTVAANVTELDSRGVSEIITIGTRAAEAAYRQRPSVPVLSALITESGFNFLALKHYGSVEGALEQGISVIYLDQPLHRLYNLGKLLLPGAQSIGIIGSDVAAISGTETFILDHPELATVNAVTLSDRSSPIKVLSPLMKRSDFVVVLPGKKSLTASVAKWVLQIGSHTRTPVIAFSKKYVTSGALAAVYTSPENVAAQIVRVLEKSRRLRSGVAQIYLPDGFSIELNTSVARILGVAPVEVADLQREVSLMEGVR